MYLQSRLILLFIIFYFHLFCQYECAWKNERSKTDESPLRTLTEEETSFPHSIESPQSDPLSKSERNSSRRSPKASLLKPSQSAGDYETLTGKKPKSSKNWIGRLGGFLRSKTKKGLGKKLEQYNSYENTQAPSSPQSTESEHTVHNTISGSPRARSSRKTRRDLRRSRSASHQLTRSPTSRSMSSSLSPRQRLPSDPLNIMDNIKDDDNEEDDTDKDKEQEDRLSRRLEEIDRSFTLVPAGMLNVEAAATSQEIEDNRTFMTQDTTDLETLQEQPQKTELTSEVEPSTGSSSTTSSVTYNRQSGSRDSGKSFGSATKDSITQTEVDLETEITTYSSSTGGSKRSSTSKSSESQDSRSFIPDASEHDPTEDENQEGEVDKIRKDPSLWETQDRLEHELKTKDQTRQYLKYFAKRLDEDSVLQSLQQCIPSKSFIIVSKSSPHPLDNSLFTLHTVTDIHHKNPCLLKQYKHTKPHSEILQLGYNPYLEWRILQKLKSSFQRTGDMPTSDHKTDHSCFISLLGISFERIDEGDSDKRAHFTAPDLILKPPLGLSLSAYTSLFHMSRSSPLCELNDLEYYEIRGLVKQLCIAIHDIHTQGIIYRNLNLETIYYLVSMEKVTLVDFSQALDTTALQGSLEEHIYSCNVSKQEYCLYHMYMYDTWGFSRFRAPEIQVSGAKKYTNKADMWSLGVVLCHILTNQASLLLTTTHSHQLSKAYVTLTESEQFKRLEIGILSKRSNLIFFIKQCLIADPSQRWSAEAALTYLLKHM